MKKQQAVPAEGSSRLLRRLSPLGVWALSFGCSVGWGAFVMPGTTFLPIAGPFGTAVGIAIGAAVMLLIGVNYSYLMNRYPDAGGTFTYTKNAFGYDHGFLSAWFFGLVYLAIIWANATALPLICRSIFGDALCFGFHYTIAGYDIYLGEILLSIATILICGYLCLRGTSTAAMVQILLAIALTAGVAVGFFASFFRYESALPVMEPHFSPDYKPGIGILFIVFLAPWAFAGFESVSNSAEEFRFPVKKTLRILIIGLVTSAAAYILLALTAVSALPADAGNWVDYVRSLGARSGLEGLPTFYAISTALGKPGIMILGVAAAAGILTGLVGNMTAASRLIYAMAREELLPKWVSELNGHGAPKYAICFLMLISLPIPFLGRSAIGWIIDVNTIGVTIAYAYTSAAALKEAIREKHSTVRITGAVGVLISFGFLIYFLVPNLLPITALSNESYFMLMAWAVLGFVAFFLIFRTDRSNRMGRSIAIWLVLLLLVFFTSMVWIVGATQNATRAAVAELSATGTQSQAALTSRFDRVTGIIIRNSVIQFVLTMISVCILFYVYSSVRKRHQAAMKEKTVAEQSSQAKTTFLSNMSHDIRTPMNAIIGYVALAKREKDLSPRTRDYLGKIEASSDHLLALINDVLEMSRIESGRMELMPVSTDLRKQMAELRDLFTAQMEMKRLNFTVTCDGVEDAHVLCDRNRLNRVLQNLVSNAYKFTPEGGDVAVTLRQTGREGANAAFRLSVKDSGIGMSPEFAAKVFEAYEREKTETVENIQGSGLGTAITKSIVELMGGTISVVSEQGKGSEFIIEVSFPMDPQYAGAAMRTGKNAAESAFAGMRLLLVEDDPDNRDVERTLLEEAGFTVDTAENGEDAVEIIASSVPGDYAVVLMDIEMPVKNGYSSTRLIRSLKNRALAEIPIVALTAKAFSEDIAAAQEAGMNGHIAKPINMKNVMDTLTEVLKQ